MRGLNLLADTDLTRRDGAPAAVQTGFFNRERVVEVFDHHDWGTSWLVDLIESAGALYRQQHLAKPEFRFDALMTLNDASPPMGGASPDHFGHQTGLVIDLLLPRTDGTVRREPQSTAAADAPFDRAAMAAMLVALRDTQKVKDKPLFYDLGGDADYQNLFTKNEVCKRFVQVQVAKPAPGPGAVPPGVTGALTGDNRPRLAARFRALGYHWADDAEVAASRHVYDQGGQPARDGRRYKLATATFGGLEWAVRLFKAIIAGRSVVDQRRALDLTLSAEELGWLYAQNAPAWVPVPVGTVEAHARLIQAVRTLQAVVAGRETTRGSSGRIAPHDETEEWLSAPHVPKWVPLLEEGSKFDVVAVPHAEQQRGRATIPDWTKQLLTTATGLYDAARAGQTPEWGRLAVLHPAATASGGGPAESGLRVRVRVAGLPLAARVAVATSFRDASAQLTPSAKLVMRHKFAAADAAAFAAAGVDASELPAHADVIEVLVPARRCGRPAARPARPRPRSSRRGRSLRLTPPPHRRRRGSG